MSIICNTGPAPTITTTPRTKTPLQVRRQLFSVIQVTCSLLIRSNDTVATIRWRMRPVITPVLRKPLLGSTERFPNTSTRLPINPGARVGQSVAWTSVHPESAGAAGVHTTAVGRVGTHGGESEAAVEPCVTGDNRGACVVRTNANGSSLLLEQRRRYRPK